jgi:asparagine synthase (glutamine-hydrolysing)
MCGIAGWCWGQVKEKEALARRMAQSMAHRGPDQEGFYFENQACLIHRRLAVVDIEHGRQPMTLSVRGERYTLVYNGELYNTQDIRDELAALDWDFVGHGDTEVLLKALIQWGLDALARLNGIFAFALWEEFAGRLTLVRDPMGVKPLFFSRRGEAVVFASLIQSLLLYPGLEPVIDSEGLSEIFLLGPARTLGQGVFKNIEEVLPGQWLRWQGGRQSAGRYWQLEARPHEDDRETTVEKTRFLVTDAITRQLVSDVPLATFLSGGLDSSIISALAAAHMARSGQRLTTYSVDYEDNQRFFTQSLFQPGDDKPYIEAMSAAIGSDHRRVVLNNGDLARALPDAALHRGVPGMADVDSSLYLFCRQVREDFTVALSGECADELFGGYPWYHNREMLMADSFPWSRSLALRSSLLAPGLLPKGEEYVRQRYLDTLAQTPHLPNESPVEHRMREMFVLNLYWFMQTLLDRKDRMSMAHGLEVRVPFCDKRIVEYAFNMPWELKSLDGREKGILRSAMAGLLPDTVLWRKKSPYPKTFHPDYTRLVSRLLRDILSDPASKITALLDLKAVNALLADPARISQPWYGQLMQGPQILAYLIQVETILRSSGARVEPGS